MNNKGRKLEMRCNFKLLKDKDHIQYWKMGNCRASLCNLALDTKYLKRHHCILTQ